MAKYNNVKELFIDICDAIRSKTDTTDLIKHEDIPEKIGSIQGAEPPEVDVSYAYSLYGETNTTTIRNKINELYNHTIENPYKIYNLKNMLGTTTSGGKIPSSFTTITSVRNVINTSYMFSNQNSLTSLNVNNINTSKVVDMSNMFAGCSALTSLNVNNFDTSNVINMTYMFNSCDSLTNLNVSNFDTSNVINMSYMFAGCDNLTSLNVSNLDTSNVIRFEHMFNACLALTSLDLSNFDTRKASGTSPLNLIFGSCAKLQSLKLGKNFVDSTSSSQWFNNSTYQSIDIDMGGNTNFTNYNGTATLSLSYIWRGSSDTYKEKYVNFANSLGECSSTKTRNIRIYTNLYNALSAEQKALITDKGYTLTYGT